MDDNTGRTDDPKHYSNGGRVETIDVIAQLGWLEDFCKGNVLKYLTRYKHKGGVDDLRKAIRYIEFLIDAEHDDGGE